jgi:uncharacterized protein YeaC (DUF1315 family)
MQDPDPSTGADAPTTFVAAAAALDRPTYESLRRALEVGRWPDGRRLEPRQREICLQSVIAWEAAHLPPEARTGHLERSSCAEPDATVDRIRILGDS